MAKFASGIASVRHNDTTVRKLCQRQLRRLCDLVEEILAKFSDGGVVMTDTCDAARKFRRRFIEHIKSVAEERGVERKDIHVHGADCWQHLRNVWVGGVINQLSERLSEILDSDLKKYRLFYVLIRKSRRSFAPLKNILAETLITPKVADHLSFITYRRIILMRIYIRWQGPTAATGKTLEQKVRFPCL